MLADPVKSFQMRKQEVHVTIPKFKVEMSMALPSVLQKLGMKDLFAEVSKQTNISNMYWYNIE